jgi:ClpP class serine protease
MSYWLLAPVTLALIADGRRRCVDPAHALAWEATALSAQVEAAADGQLPRCMSIAGSTAEIRIAGVLTKNPDFFSMFFGGGNTTYVGIRNAIAVAVADPNIKTIVLAVDSPGGEADGLIETLDHIAALRATSGKTLRVRADNAQSAAYAIAAAGGTIEAVGRGATFGSIGTAISYYVEPDVVTLTNTDSPDKRPDVTTAEGKAVVVKYLDQVETEFVRAIARGRGVEASAITDGYGRGASFTAPNALRIGMIDKISSTPLRAVSNRNPKSMSEEQTPESRAEASRNTEAAVQRGVAQERDRVVGHLTLGESCGDLSIALEAIRSGAGMTHEFNARYMSAGMNRADRSTRQAESKAAEAAVAGAPPVTPATADLGEQVVALLKAPSDRSFVRG